MSDELRHLWRTQPSEARPPAPEELRARAGAFERTIRRRNVREYAAGAIVVAFFGARAMFTDRELERVGSILVAGGAAFVVTFLARRGSAGPRPDALALDGVSYLRAELSRQRDLLRAVWFWYLGPLAPGLALVAADSIIKAARSGHGLAIAIGAAGVIVAAFTGIGALNMAGARSLSREIEALDELTGGRGGSSSS